MPKEVVRMRIINFSGSAQLVLQSIAVQILLYSAEHSVTAEHGSLLAKPGQHVRSNLSPTGDATNHTTFITQHNLIFLNTSYIYSHLKLKRKYNFQFYVL